MSFGTGYNVRDIHGLYGSFNLMKCDIVKLYKQNVLSKSHGFASHFLDRNSKKVVFHKVFEFLCCSLVLNRNKDSVILRLKIGKRNKRPLQIFRTDVCNIRTYTPFTPTKHV